MSKTFTKKVLSFAIAMITVLSAVIIPLTGIIASAANDTFEDAELVVLDQQYTGSVTSADKNDYYKIILSEAGLLKIKTTTFCFIYYDVYGQNKEGIVYDSIDLYNAPGFKNEALSLYLTAGTYYVKYHKWSGEGEYNVTFSFESANETVPESYGGSNETLNTAFEIPLNEKYYGVVAKNEKFDFYKFTLNEKKKIKIKFHTDNASWVQFYNSDGAEIYGNSYVNNSYTATGDDNREYELDAGTYYYVVRSTNGIYSTYSLIVECEKSTPVTPVTNYTVNYNAMGGTECASSTVAQGDSVTLPTPVKKYTLTYNLNGGEGENYIQYGDAECLGWSKSSSATNANHTCGTAYTPTANTTLYAVWGAANYKLYGDVPVRDGYVFLGWSTDAAADNAEYEGSDSYTALGNSTLYAVWEKDDDEGGFSFLGIFEIIFGFFIMIIDAITALLS